MIIVEGYFAYAAHAEKGSDQFVLSTTNPVAIPAAARLDFFVYLAGKHCLIDTVKVKRFYKNVKVL